MKEKKKVSRRVIGAAIGFQAVIGGITIRDINKRARDQVRGPRLLWKIWGGTNTLGSLAYWLFGRRRRRASLKP